MRRWAAVLLCAFVQAKINSDVEETVEDYESSERLGAVVTQVYRHPYVASVLKNNTYECSAVILNTYWLMTLMKCFDPEFTSSYLSSKKMDYYTIRTGSSYNNKSGSIYKIKTLINNFDLRVSAVKLDGPMEFEARVQAVHLPAADEDIALGYLASVLAWTPDGHMRVVNVPVIESAICEDITKLASGHYVCVGGVQDPDRNFCRKDNGGAVIQNNTLIALATFHQSCALYTKPHAFPKVSSFATWIHSVIWDEDNRPTTLITSTVTKDERSTPTTSIYFMDPSKFMITLPYDPINLPLQPSEDNSVLPRFSLYESYLQNLAKAKTSTTVDPNAVDKEKVEWLTKYGKAIMMMPPEYVAKKYDQFEY